MSTYYQTQEINTQPTSEGWYAHTCYNYRSSLDDSTNVQPVRPGTTISWKAGYKYWNTGGTNEKYAGSQKDWQKFVLEDSATTMILSSALLVSTLILF